MNCMRLPHYFKALKEQTIRNKLNIIIGLVIIILLFGLLNFWFSMRMMSGIRAYVGGEGLWSKAEKAAVINLGRYVTSDDETDYQTFLTSINVQLGDRRARLEMNKPEPDMTVVRNGFIQGRNHPDDVGDLYFLYRHFKNVSYMKSAIQIWVEADDEIANLRSVGEQLHELIANSASPESGGIGLSPVQRTKLYDLFRQLYATDARLTTLEDRFSATLGEGSRRVTRTLVIATIITTSLLGFLALSVAIMITKALIRLDKQKSEFVSLASHQLRTPLTAINWSAEALQTRSSSNLTVMQHKYVAKLREGSQRMAALIGDLLRMSSLDLGTYRLEEKKVKINDIIATATRDQQKKINEKNISLTIHVEPNIPTMKTDEQLLSIIVQNLVSNSVKYCRKDGRIRIDVGIKKEHLLVHIADNGIGIPSKQQRQIFSKLFRADNAVEHNFSEGTGLGLYIAKAMVERLGGKIWFNSVENIGSDFYVKIPL